jgi:hypothetical protein
MSAEAATTGTVQVSKRLSVTISVSRLGMTCEGEPAPPVQLTRKELQRYRAGRNALVAEAAQRLGGSALVIEI